MLQAGFADCQKQSDAGIINTMWIQPVLIKRILFGLLVSALLLGAAGCGAVPPSPEATATSRLPTVTFSPPTPSATSAPLAARVNGEGILLSDYQAELQRLQNAETELSKSSKPEEQQQRVLEDLIDQTLLAQAAEQAGFTIDEAALQAKIDELAGQLGGSQALQDWQNRHGYTPESFQLALKRSLLAAWQRDQIIAKVPDRAEQAHARQILVLDADLANQIYGQLQSGVDFATLAKRYDPLTSGDLGWFPRGYLTQPEVEAAIFELQPGQYSQVIQTSFGYHIVQLIEIDPQRTLSPDAHLLLQRQALAKWLEERRSQSQIEILLP